LAVFPGNRGDIDRPVLAPFRSGFPDFPGIRSDREKNEFRLRKTGLFKPVWNPANNKNDLRANSPGVPPRFSPGSDVRDVKFAKIAELFQPVNQLIYINKIKK